MFQSIRAFILSIVLILISVSIGSADGEDRIEGATDELAVYVYAALDRYWEFPAIVQVRHDAPIQEKLQVLMDAASKEAFQNRTIRVVRIEEKEGQKTAIIDLQDPYGDQFIGEPLSWYHTFQGSTGGAYTSETFRDTLSQYAYCAPWPDKFRILWNGEPAYGDHIEPISGTFRRRGHKPLTQSVLDLRVYSRISVSHSPGYSRIICLEETERKMELSPGKLLIAKEEILSGTGVLRKTAYRIITESFLRSGRPPVWYLGKEERAEDLDEPYTVEMTFMEVDSFDPVRWNKDGSEPKELFRRTLKQ